MGYTKAAQVLLFNERLTAQEAYIAGFVSKVIPDAQFKEETWKMLEGYTNLSNEVRTL